MRIIEMALSDPERQEIRDLVKSATEEAISETFRVLGIDPSNFDHVEEFRDNHRWVKKYRRMSEKIGSHVIILLTTVLSGGVFTAVWHYVTKK
jgi:hypothetical protein